MKKYEFFGLLILIVTTKCLGQDNFVTPGFSNFADETLKLNYQAILITTPIKKYVSIDLTGIVQPAGVINIGLRKESLNGWDVGINTGKSKNETLLAGYGSYLRIFDASLRVKYYGGLGMKVGHMWVDSPKIRSLFAGGLLSAGRSYITKSGSAQFFELDITWPTVYRYVARGLLYGKSSGIDYTLTKPSFALYYGLLF